jgi:acetyl-CoA carboxylase carboxyl transferase subunit alpha
MSSNIVLEFEKPILDLRNQIQKAREQLLTEGSTPARLKSIEQLEHNLTELEDDIFQNLTNWQKVQLSRHPDRPYTLDYIPRIFENWVELHGDRNVGDDKAIITGFATIDNQAIAVIGHQKGRNTKQRQMRNFGMANPEGYRKALRIMKLAEKFNRPVICFIDTPGAYPGIEAEERGQGEAIARNLKEMSVLKVPIVCVIIGEGASGGALGIGVGDKILMQQYTWYSVISPESCSSILWRSWDYKEKAADALQLSSEQMLNNKLIDGIIPEPRGGAHNDYELAASLIKKELMKQLDELNALTSELRITNRIDKFSNMGVYA